MKKMSVNEIRDIIFENYYKWIGFSKENSYYSIKDQKKGLQFFAIILTEKIPDPRNVKKHCQSFIKKKFTKSVKQSKIITQQAKTSKNQTLLI